MKNIKYVFFALIFTVLFSGIVSAETIKINKISENNLDYKFDILIDEITNEKNINVVEGVIYYDSKLVKSIELVTSSNWEFKYKLENDKLIFISYVASDFAVSRDSLFNLNVSLNENVDKNNVQLLINDLLTNNGDNLFSFEKMLYKFEKITDSVVSEPPTIDKGEVENKIETIVKPQEKPSKNENQSSSSEEKDEIEEEKDYVCEPLPGKPIINQIVVKDSRNNYNWILWGVIVVLAIFNIILVIIISRLVYKKETSIKEDPIRKKRVVKKVSKKKTTAKKGVK